jgi:hypothetical protein
MGFEWKDIYVKHSVYPAAYVDECRISDLRKKAERYTSRYGVVEMERGGGDKDGLVMMYDEVNCVFR